MAYQHSQLARECSAVTTPSARLVLMILASAMDKDKHTCFWRWKTLLHYSKLSRSTLASALKEIEASGIITRQHRYRQSNIYVWHTDVAEGLRDPVKQESEDRSQETQAEAVSWDSDVFEITPEDRVIFLGELRTMFVPQSDGTKPYEDEWLEFVSDKDEREAMTILKWMLAENRASRLREHLPTVAAGRPLRFKMASLKASWSSILRAYAQSQERSVFDVDDEVLA